VPRDAALAVLDRRHILFVVQNFAAFSLRFFSVQPIFILDPARNAVKQKAAVAYVNGAFSCRRIDVLRDADVCHSYKFYINPFLCP